MTRLPLPGFIVPEGCFRASKIGIILLEASFGRRQIGVVLIHQSLIRARVDFRAQLARFHFGVSGAIERLDHARHPSVD